MAITQVLRLSIPVSDQDRAKAFYVDALGFEMLGDHPVPMGENARWLEVAPKGAATSIVLGTWFPNMAPGSIEGLMLETGTLAEDCERLRKAGVTVSGPFETPWGHQATVNDPDGNGLVLTAAAPTNA